MVQINQNRGHIIVESVNVSCLITSIPNQLIIMAMEQISIIFANTALNPWDQSVISILEPSFNMALYVDLWGFPRFYHFLFVAIIKLFCTVRPRFTLSLCPWKT